MMTLDQLRDIFRVHVDDCATLRCPGWTFLAVEPTTKCLNRARFAGFASAVLGRLDGVLAAAPTDDGWSPNYPPNHPPDSPPNSPPNDPPDSPPNSPPTVTHPWGNPPFGSN